MDQPGHLDHDPRRMLYFEPFSERAAALLAADDADALTELAGRAQRKLGDSRDPFVLNVRDRADRLARFVKAYAAGRSGAVATEDLQFALAALVYFLSPTDQIPDAKPGGQTDDAAVLAFAARELHDSIDAALGT